MKTDELLFDDLDSPVGNLRLVGTKHALRAVLWQREREGRVRLPALTRGERIPLFKKAKTQLAEYFAGKRHEFDLPLDPHGTEFQQKAWLALRQIPYGKTVSYGEQARAMGLPKSARAVGAANGRNPLSIFVPCHRVVGSSGKLTGFAGGLDTKRFLLDLESLKRY